MNEKHVKPFERGLLIAPQQRGEERRGDTLVAERCRGRLAPARVAAGCWPAAFSKIDNKSWAVFFFSFKTISVYVVCAVSWVVLHTAEWHFP